MALQKTGCWIFQANPKLYLIKNALSDYLQMNRVDLNWMINQHKKHIKEGDKVIIWVCGKQSGIYALARVASNVMQFEDKDDPYYVDKSRSGKRDRTRLILEHNLINRPVYKEEVLRNPLLCNMNQGIPLTNLKAKDTEYNAVLELLSKRAHP